MPAKPPKFSPYPMTPLPSNASSAFVSPPTSAFPTPIAFNPAKRNKIHLQLSCEWCAGGHDFSRAAKPSKVLGFSPCGLGLLTLLIYKMCPHRWCRPWHGFLSRAQRTAQLVETLHSLGGRSFSSDIKFLAIVGL